MHWGKRWVGWGWLIVALAVPVPLTVEASGRVALVIGNSRYAERPLRNPPNDARAMAGLLRQLGFAVTEKTDLDLRGFRAQVNAFLDQSRGADLRLFYYSGHGASYDGDNYLLPIGHGVTRKHELPDQAYSLKTLLRGLKDQGGVNSVTMGTLVIRNSQPRGAVLYVNGKRLGAVPQTVTLKAGQHTIEAKQAGYVDYRDTVQVRAGEQTVLNVVLTAIPREPAPVVVTPAPVERPPRPVAETLMGDRYRDHGDGTVTDVKTGLQWMRCSLGQTWRGGTCVDEAEKYTWQAALDAARSLNRQGGYAGHRDWRVPKKEELQTLIYCSSGQPEIWKDTEGGCESDFEPPTIYKPAFPNMPQHLYYRSSSTADHNPHAVMWIVGFDQGIVGFGGRRNTSGMCVSCAADSNLIFGLAPVRWRESPQKVDFA